MLCSTKTWTTRYESYWGLHGIGGIEMPATGPHRYSTPDRQGQPFFDYRRGWRKDAGWLDASIHEAADGPPVPPAAYRYFTGFVLKRVTTHLYADSHCRLAGDRRRDLLFCRAVLVVPAADQPARR